MTIRWVVFDAVGTLLTPHPSVAGIYHAVGQEFGSVLSLDDVKSRFRRAFLESEFCRSLPEEAWADPENFRTNERDEYRIWSAIVAAVLDDVGDAKTCFDDVFSRFEDANSWQVLPGVEQGLSALQAAGFRLAVASNFDSRLNALLDGLPVFAAIERRVISSEVAYRKPSLHFFRAAEKLMHASPGEILMVGDDLVNDIQAARNAGWQAVRLVMREQGTSPATGDDEIESIADVRDWIHRHGKSPA
ncbi:MAG: HAD-IIIA family hydrolase [Planctomycetaceae bacterium]